MKKEYFTIPNLMGYFRILMLPVFLFIYQNADSRGDYILAFTILTVSLLTDFFDGKIARKFNMVTDFGKILDPVADKLTQGVLAIAVALRQPLMGYFLALFIIKEIYMSAMGLYLIKKKHVRNGAQWYGKICTAATDVGIVILLLFPEMSWKKANTVILIMMAFLIFSLANYLVFHIRILRGESEKPKGRIRWGLVILAIAAYELLGASLPYLKQPEVSEEYQEKLETEDFYAEELSCDRAAVIEDNGEALEERIRLIELAQERVILSTFDFRSDTAGRQMIAALLSAAERGVQVSVMLDGFNFFLQIDGNPYFYALAANENVEIRVYNPINFLTPWKGMSRMHDKYLIADETAYILGGRNTFNYFLGDQKSHKNYDRDVLVYNTAYSAGGTDSSLYQVTDYFEKLWGQDLCRPWKIPDWIAKTANVKDAIEELHKIYGDMPADWLAPADYEKQTFPTNRITLLSNPTHLYSKEPRVFYALGELMRQAKEQVVIHTPYIMCSDMMYESFEKICAEEIPITLMTNSAKNNGNSFGAVDFVLNKEKILDTGLHVLEYNGGISYHGKSILIDDDISVVGSFNMDMKSVYQDTELMLVIHSKEVNAQLSQNLYAYQADADEAQIQEDKWKEIYEGQPLKGKALRTVVRIFDPFLRFLM